MHEPGRLVTEEASRRHRMTLFAVVGQTLVDKLGHELHALVVEAFGVHRAAVAHEHVVDESRRERAQLRLIDITALLHQAHGQLQQALFVTERRRGSVVVVVVILVVVAAVVLDVVEHAAHASARQRAEHVRQWHLGILSLRGNAAAVAALALCRCRGVEPAVRVSESREARRVSQLVDKEARCTRRLVVVVVVVVIGVVAQCLREEEDGHERALARQRAQAAGGEQALDHGAQVVDHVRLRVAVLHELAKGGHELARLVDGGRRRG